MRTCTLLLLAMLCLELTYTNAQEHQDCYDAFPICSFDTYHFEEMKGYGKTQNIDQDLLCFYNQFKETNSKWIKFSIKEKGVVTFTINPSSIGDDLDFVLFKMDQDCQDLEALRCMASGETLGRKNKQANVPCQGQTGLSLYSIDEFETTGCKYSDDNFLKYLQADAGDQYFLMINNYNSSSGFSITLEGTANIENTHDCVQVTSVNEVISLSVLEVFPNPSAYEVQVDYTSTSTEKVEIQILDFMGKSYQKRWIDPKIGYNTSNFSIADLPQGSYLFNLRQGAHSSTKQFVKF